MEKQDRRASGEQGGCWGNDNFRGEAAGSPLHYSLWLLHRGTAEHQISRVFLEGLWAQTTAPRCFPMSLPLSRSNYTDKARFLQVPPQYSQGSNLTCNEDWHPCASSGNQPQTKLETARQVVRFQEAQRCKAGAIHLPGCSCPTYVPLAGQKTQGQDLRFCPLSAQRSC